MKQFENQFVRVQKGIMIPVITEHQLSLMIGRKYNQVAEASKKILRHLGETQLNTIYPFPHGEREESGPRFIIMDDKYEDYITKCLNNPIKKK